MYACEDRTGRQGDQVVVLSVARTVIFLTMDAKMAVAKRGTKSFELVAQYTVADSPVWASPVFVNKQILIKDSSTLALWSLE